MSHKPNRSKSKLSKECLDKVLQGKPKATLPDVMVNKLSEQEVTYGFLIQVTEYFLSLEELGFGKWTITDIYDAFEGLIQKHRDSLKKTDSTRFSQTN